MLSRKRIVWGYWFVTVLLLVAYFAGLWADAIYAVIVLAAVQAVHFLALERRLMAFPV